jgi:hypothetical protein
MSDLLDSRALFEAKQCKPLVAAAAQGDEARRDLGLRLLGCRTFWPKRGPKAKGWGQFLAEIGLEDRTARRYMTAARPKVSDTVSEKSPRRRGQRLTDIEWMLLRGQLGELFDVLWHHARGLVDQRRREWHDAAKDYKKRHPKSTPDVEPNWGDLFNKCKADSFDRLVQVQELVQKLATAEGVDLQADHVVNGGMDTVMAMARAAAELVAA